MKIITSLSLIMVLTVLSCKKEKENQVNNSIDTISTSDNTVTPPVTSDTITTAIPPRDSAYTVTTPGSSKKDSIK
ncbi:hypothetical protein [Chryseobacterium tongliaoense]|uniref:hypothetical protein n=1 Tax=Chryseobacterium tongliaoense TaxID=3240933 RepID=UPI0035142B34